MEPRRLLSGGTLDSTFGTGGTTLQNAGGAYPAAYGMARQSDGKIVQVGAALRSGTSMDFVIDRYNTDGSPDTSFGQNGQIFVDFGGNADTARAVAIQGDGKIVVAGESATILNLSNLVLQRYNTDGTLDSSFGNGGTVQANFGLPWASATSVAIQPDGKIVTGGKTTLGSFSIARFNSNGSPDLTFNTTGLVSTTFNLLGSLGASESLSSMVLQPDGKILAGGFTKPLFTNKHSALVRFNSDGTLDTTFGNGGRVEQAFGQDNSWIDALSLTPEGKIVTSGYAVVGGGTNAIARFNSDGSLDTTFNGTGLAVNSFSSEGRGVAALPGGKILVAAAGFVYLTRLNPDGSIDTGFGTNGDVETTWGNMSHPMDAMGLIVQPNGTAIVGASDIQSFGLAKYVLTIPPTANVGGPYSAPEGGGNIAMSAAQSTDPDGSIISYDWDLNYNGAFNPTRSGAAQTFSTAGLTAGQRTIALRVLDNDGAYSPIVTTTLTITDVAPVVTVSPPKTVTQGDSVTFSGSFTDPDMSDTYAGSWRVVNAAGATVATATTPSITFVAADNGVYTATYTVTAGDGQVGSASTTVTSNVIPPIVSISGAPAVDEGSNYVLNLSATLPAIETISSWTINWGDGNIQTVSGNPSSTTHAYATGNQNYTIVASATDDDGTWSSGNTVGVFVNPNLALNHGVAWSTQTTGFEASKVVDGNTATRWQSSVSGQQWVYTDLGATYDITHVRVNWASAYASVYRIQVSDDKTFWRDLYSTTSGQGGVSDLTGLSGSGQFVRVLCTTPSGSNTNYSIWEFEVYGSSNLALGRPGSARSQVAGGEWNKAFDGDTATHWTSSTNGNEWLYTDLGSTFNINHVKVKWDANYASSYKVELSNDGSIWRDASSITNGTGGWADITGFSGVGRYVRIECFTAAGSAANYQIDEFQVFGTNNLALGRPMIYSSQQSAYPASNVVDNNPSTAWASTTTGTQWVGVDLGFTFTSLRVKIDWGVSYASSFKLQVSDDNATWRDMTSMSNSVGGTTDFSGLSGTGRYVRVLCLTPSGSNSVYSMYNLEIYATENLALNKNASGSSEQAGYEPWRATDGDAQSSWRSSSAGTQWMFTDLGSVYNISRIMTNWDTAYASSFKMQVSTDASNWTDVYTNTANTSTSNDVSGFWNPARYVRVYCLAPSGSNTYYALDELKIWGTV